MASSLESNSKPTAKKAVVGKSKKKTVWWKKVFIGSSVAVLMLSVGFSGYTWWNTRQLKARAAGYYSINSSGFTVYFCRQVWDNRYGKWFIYNSSGSSLTVRPNTGGAFTVPARTYSGLRNITYVNGAYYYSYSGPGNGQGAIYNWAYTCP